MIEGDLKSHIKCTLDLFVEFVKSFNKQFKTDYTMCCVELYFYGIQSIDILYKRVKCSRTSGDED